MAPWDRPQTAEELAAKPRRRPFDELIRECAAARGIPTLRVHPPRPTHVPRRPAGNRWS